MDFPTAHALLRDRHHWRGSTLGVAPDDDGDLALARIPAPADGKGVSIATSLPYTREVSGIAAGPCQALFVADTAQDRLLFIDGQCNAQAWLPPAPVNWTGAPGTFKTLRALACAADALLVADSGNARIQSLAFAQLEANLTCTAWSEPISLAIDSKQRVLVIDAATKTLCRMSVSGKADAAFNAAVAASGRLAQPLFVACDSDNRVLVADVQHNEVLVFDENGAVLHSLPGTAGWLPGALATWGAQVYVADASSGVIAVFMNDATTARHIGTISGWQGPVTALAVGADGTLYIKPGLDALFYRFVGDAAYLASGIVNAGPFDAGEDREWERTFAESVVPAGTSVAFEVATANSDAAPPAPGDWVLLPAPDALLSRFTPGGRRFAWLRLTLASTDSTVTPQVRQARLATAAEDYLDYLPLTYRYNDDGPDGFLSRWLRLMRSEFSRVEAQLDDVPRVADPQFVPAESLAWLAQWFGLELPQIADDVQRRALVARAVTLMARRGTPQSIATFVELHTGIEPVIVEGFTDRRIWVLGQNSLLDFDTRLAPLDPLGMVVPDPAREAGCCPAAAAPIMAEPRSPCANAQAAPAQAAPVLAIGRAVVGESGPLAEYQIGLPLFAEDAYRFCVVVDAYRAADPQIVQEIRRIVEREKPAHTDWRLDLIAPELRVGFQCRIGIDAIVGGDPPPLALGRARLCITSHLPPPDVARIGSATLDGSLSLT
ncbi:phage tail-like protein [Paraburkholderia sp. JPY158]|uniref:Phage tail-like protein n=1 Tax=Paraburkholderia atlantica TaxID=2654982 RepID=A0A7W8VAQ7_PARAM|nr:phage tail protein [Paraburkholderia atlantica]MBB5429113.1 phage tail-like protein [Paraburkholderia atlantica]